MRDTEMNYPEPSGFRTVRAWRDEKGKAHHVRLGRGLHHAFAMEVKSRGIPSRSEIASA